MCVSDSSGAIRSQLFSRGDFMAIAAVATEPGVNADKVDDSGDINRYPLSAAPPRLSTGNALAAALAARSPLVAATFARVCALANSVSDATVRDSIIAFLHDSRPYYGRAHPAPQTRLAVRDELAAAHFVEPDAPVDGIFPPGTRVESPSSVQPFWSAPGSSDGSHHAYPGGLAVHECFNAAMAVQFAQTYDRHYFHGAAAVDRDTVVAAALYHDVCKTVVFGWNADGSLFEELTIAGTGAHHILSGAEAIARGRTPRFVTTLLSAHAAPSLGDETKVAAWCRAAAIVAGVDPVAYGLLTPTGTLAANPVPLEAFINHLSDHDYVVSIHAMHIVGGLLRDRYALATARTKPPDGLNTFAWYRSAILTRTTAIALYDTLARHGSVAFNAALSRAEIDLWPTTERA